MSQSGESSSLIEATTGDDLLAYYLRMYRIRCFEEEVLALRADNLITGSVHPCIGQESAPVGVLSALGSSDPVLATYRGHGWALECGVSVLELFAELMGRQGGTNNGRGGSPYLTAPGTRFLGENSIVGAGLPIANGVALASRLQDMGEIVLASFGDGATNQGASHEALVFAVANSLPVLFVCENNGWSEMTAITQTVPVSLSDRARSYGLHAVTTDGTDVTAVAAMTRDLVREMRDTSRPAFLEVVVPRLKGHYNADVEHYRSEADKAEAVRRDPVAEAHRHLIASGVSQDDLDRLEAEVRVAVQRAREEAMGFEPASGDPTTHVWRSIAPAAHDELPSEGTEMAYGLAVNEAVRRELASRPNVVVFGEDVAVPGGVFGVTRGLRKEFGEERVFDTPIAEAAILGAAVGASQRGLRPIVEVMWADFLLVALDQLVNQAANVRYISEGRVTAPMVVRTQQGVTPGSCAQHSQSLEGMLAVVPGLKIGIPSTAHDAYTMLRAAVEDDDPVVLIESRALYLTKGIVDTEAPIESASGARLRKAGSDLLIVTWGRITAECLKATEVLAARGIDAGVVDVRWIAPFDFEFIADQLPLHSGKVLIVHEANVTGGFGAEVAARLASECIDVLDGPVVRVGAPDIRMPAAPSLQERALPNVATIIEAAERLHYY